MFFSDAPTPAGAEAPGRTIIGYEGERRVILATDDDVEHLEMLRAMLCPLGFDLIVAQNAADCLSAYRDARPDLVMLDINMPGGDGWGAARGLRGEHGDDPVILMVSANVHDFQRSRREDDPHDDFLTKPFEYDVLLERIGTLLDIEWTYGSGAA
jgi:DNA-binding response OmpR family regulator